MRGAAPGRAAAREGAGAAESRAADPDRRACGASPPGPAFPRACLASGPVLEDAAVRRALPGKLASPFGLRRLRVALAAGR